MPELNVRIKSKHDTTENWDNATGFIPMSGEIIIYDDYAQKDNKNIPGIKIGTGNAYVQDLPFVSEQLRDSLLSHINNEERHVTTAQKTVWNNKVNIDDTYDVLYEELEDETLIFNRN